MAKENPMFYC